MEGLSVIIIIIIINIITLPILLWLASKWLKTEICLLISCQIWALVKDKVKLTEVKW